MTVQRENAKARMLQCPTRIRCDDSTSLTLNSPDAFRKDTGYNDGSSVSRTNSRGPLLCDGAMGTLIHQRGLPIDACFDELNLSARDDDRRRFIASTLLPAPM